MSGAPIASSALAAPQRARRGGGKQQQAPAEQLVPSLPHNTDEPVNYQAYIAAQWQAVAQTPGASPLVQQIAQQAQVGG